MRGNKFCGEAPIQRLAATSVAPRHRGIKEEERRGKLYRDCKILLRANPERLDPIIEGRSLFGAKLRGFIPMKLDGLETVGLAEFLQQRFIGIHHDRHSRNVGKGHPQIPDPTEVSIRRNRPGRRWIKIKSQGTGTGLYRHHGILPRGDPTDLRHCRGCREKETTR